jgi:hypothetical protein
VAVAGRWSAKGLCPIQAPFGFDYRPAAVLLSVFSFINGALAALRPLPGIAAISISRLRLPLARLSGPTARGPWATLPRNPVSG